MKRALLTAACACALAGLPAVRSSAQITSPNIDCRDLKLQDAAGVPDGARHSYELAGTCYGPKPGRPRTDYKTFPASAFMRLYGEWDGATNTFKEHAKLEGGVAGTVHSTFKCSADPYLQRVRCTLMSHTNSTPWPGLSISPQSGVPIGQIFVNPARAAQLSSQTGKKGASSPSPISKAFEKTRPAPQPSRPIGKTVMRGLGGMEPGVNRPGGNYHRFSPAQPRPELCRRACLGDARCRSWTFAKPGGQRKRAVCFLKNTVPPPRKNPCCTSGVK